MHRILRSLATTATISVTLSLGLTAEPPPDIAKMKVEELRAGGDVRMQYFVIHRPVDPPKSGWRTLFVLPGGSGDASFQPFVTRVAQNAVPESYLVVQLVAPVWSVDQARTMVWPTGKSGLTEVKFSTSEFFLAVRAELATKHKLDPRYSFTLTWSSSGPNGYALSLEPKSGITGTFVAMSVFKPAILSRLSGAKGHPYFLYHSPQDFIPMAQPEAARAALQKAGATVELETYEGGHGWHGNIFGDISKGIGWLEQQVAKTPRKTGS
jgi:predicted esterase